MADNQRIDDLRRRVQRDPASIAFAQLAEECRRAGHFQEAVDVCRTGLDLHPGYLSARVTLGRALIELNDLDIALAELQHVLKAAPENLAAIRGIAEIHHRQGSLAEALAQYRAALALARNDPDLQRTVDELARKVEPLPPPASADGLSFEQMQNEFLQNLPPPPPVKAPAPEPPPAPTVDPEPDPMPEASPIVTEAVTAVDPEPLHEPEPSPIVAEAVTAADPEPEPDSETSPIVAEAPAAAAEVEAVHVEEAPAEDAGKTRAVHTIAALEQWIEAIHVARAQSRA
jgi:tetratricopeptide (TPR) repeat protein